MNKLLPLVKNKNVCSQCGDCCRIFFINIDKEEYESGRFKTVFENIETINDFSKAADCGANFLAKREDGSCIYLENNSCNIHTVRPQVCREFFCSSDDKKHKNMRGTVKQYKQSKNKK